MMSQLRGLAVAFFVNHLDDIMRIEQRKDQTTKAVAYIYEDPSASLETIDINPEWGHLPIILYLNRLGQYRNVYQKIELLKRLNSIIIFTGNLHQSCTDAQILSSQNIHTGIRINPKTPLDDEILDLITYSFYTTAPHAPIEPFAVMEKYYCGDNRVSPAMGNFENPERYIHMNRDGHLAMSKEALDKGDFFEVLPEEFFSLAIHPKIVEAKHSWQQMFINSHPCTFCPAFRVCMGYFAESNTENCKRVMLELLESIEFKKQNNPNNNEQCQL